MNKLYLPITIAAIIAVLSIGLFSTLYSNEIHINPSPERTTMCGSIREDIISGKISPISPDVKAVSKGVRGLDNAVIQYLFLQTRHINHNKNPSPDSCYYDAPALDVFIEYDRKLNTVSLLSPSTCEKTEDNNLPAWFYLLLNMKNWKDFQTNWREESTVNLINFVLKEDKICTSTKNLIGDRIIEFYLQARKLQKNNLFKESVESLPNIDSLNLRKDLFFPITLVPLHKKMLLVVFTNVENPSLIFFANFDDENNLRGIKAVNLD